MLLVVLISSSKQCHKIYGIRQAQISKSKHTLKLIYTIAMVQMDGKVFDPPPLFFLFFSFFGRRKTKREQT